MGEKFYMKKYVTGSKTLVAICDEEILGMVFKEGDLVLDVSRSFYQGDLIDAEEALEEIRLAELAVLTGKRIVTLAIKAGLVHREAILNIRGQLHAQIMRW